MSELSKVKIGGQVYDLKDATARDNVTTLLGGHAIEALGAAAWKAVATEIGGTGLVEASTVKAYVDSAIEKIPEFDVVVVADGGKLPTASADTFHKIYLMKDSAPIAGNSYDEYITVRGGAKGAYTYSWEKVGSTAIDISGKVDKTTTICGIALDHNITVEEIKTALGLKALAYKDEASATLADYATGINGAAYTPAGTVEVASTTTSTEMSSTGKFTPAGSVTGTTTAAGSVSIARDDVNGVAVSGSVSAPTITVTPATATVQHIDSLGKLATYKAAQYTAPSVKEAKSAFATAGVVASIDKTDAEMLVFEAAGTANALTGTGFNAGSFTAATYTPGELPTLGTEQTVVTGITKAEASAPTFTGDKFGATFTGAEADITAKFAGTAADVSVKGNYDKTTVGDATFAGTAATIAPTLKTGSKTVTVK